MTSRMASAGDAATDDQLIAAVRRGNDHAFEQLYRRYSAPISRFVGSRVRDRGRAVLRRRFPRPTGGTLAYRR